MGIGEKVIPINAVTVSSHKPKNSVDELSLMQADAWQPLSNSPGEWIKVF